MGEDFGKFDPKFAAAIFDENLEKFASMALETRTYFYDSIRHSIVDPPPTLAPLPREHSPERRRARDIRSGESDRLRVRVVRAMLCGLWTLRRNVDKSADAELCVRHEISAKFASDGRNLREEICGAPKKNPRPCQELMKSVPQPSRGARSRAKNVSKFLYNNRVAFLG